MSQNSLVLPTSGTLSGLAAVQAVNNALDTLNTLASGASAPSSPEAGQFWHDTGNKLLKIRSMDNTAWITVGALDETAYTFTAPNVSGIVAQANGGTGHTSVAALFTNSFTANGYRISPDGYVEQWGTTGSIPAGTAVNVTFPMTFPNGMLNITANLITNGTLSDAAATIYPNNSSAFVIVNQSNLNTIAYWTAKGH